MPIIFSLGSPVAFSVAELASVILRNSRYLGDEYYPALIDTEVFEAAKLERIRRAEGLGRVYEPKAKNEVVSPTVFRIKEVTEQFDDPFQQAEYVYSLIENEV